MDFFKWIRKLGRSKNKIDDHRNEEIKDREVCNKCKIIEKVTDEYASDYDKIQTDTALSEVSIYDNLVIFYIICITFLARGFLSKSYDIVIYCFLKKF